MNFNVKLQTPLKGKKIYRNLAEIINEFKINGLYLEQQIEGQVNAQWKVSIPSIPTNEVSIQPFSSLEISNRYTAYVTTIIQNGSAKTYCTVTKKCKIIGRRSLLIAAQISTIKGMNTENVFFTERFRYKVLKKCNMELGEILCLNKIIENVCSLIIPGNENNTYEWSFTHGIAYGHREDGFLIFNNLKTRDIMGELLPLFEDSDDSMNP